MITTSKYINIVHVKCLTLTGHGLAMRVLFPSLQRALEAKRQNILLKFHINCAIIEIQYSHTKYSLKADYIYYIVKVEKRYCSIKKGLTKVIILYFITRHVYILTDYSYKESIEIDANLAFFILHQG